MIRVVQRNTASIGPDGRPNQGRGFDAAEALWLPGQNPAVETADTTLIFDGETHQDVLDKGGRLNVDYSAYWDGPFGPLVDGPHARKAIDGTASSAQQMVLPVDGLLQAGGPWTISLKIKPRGADMATLNSDIMAGWSQGGERFRLLTTVNGGGGRIFLYMSGLNADGTANSAVLVANLDYNSGDVPADTWRTIVVSWDGTTARLYLIVSTSTTRTATATVTATKTVSTDLWGGVEYSDIRSGLYLPGRSTVAAPDLTLAEIQTFATARVPSTRPSYVTPTITVDPDTAVAGESLARQSGFLFQYNGWEENTVDLAHGPAIAARLQDALGSRFEGAVHRVPGVLGKVAIGGTAPNFTYDYTELDRYIATCPAGDLLIGLHYTPPVLQGAGDRRSNPTSHADFATIASNVAQHIVEDHGDRVVGFSFWNEPSSTQFWTGTFNELMALWNTTRLKFATDLPTYTFGGIDTFWDGPTGYLAQWLDYCDTNGIDPGALHQHEYSGSLRAVQQDLRALRAYAVAKDPAWADLPLRVTEWSFSLTYFGHLAASAFANTGLSKTRPVSDRRLAVFNLAAMIMFQAESVDFANFTRLGTSTTGTVNEPDLGAFSNDDHPRPLASFAGLQAAAKVAGERKAATLTNAPGVYVSVADDDGAITLAYASYRLWKPDSARRINLDFETLPATFTWKQWTIDDEAAADGRLRLVASGDSENLPLGLYLKGIDGGVLEITP